MDDIKNSLVQKRVKRIVLVTRIIVALFALTIVASLIGMYLSEGDIRRVFSICLYVCLGLFALITFVTILIILVFIKKNSKDS